MLRLSKLTDYGLLITHFLLQQKEDEKLRMESIATGTHLPLATVRKLLKHLVDAKVIASYRGANGGYQVNRSAEDISVAEIIEAIEGPIRMTECSQNSGSCDLEETCALKTPLNSINEIVMNFLKTITLAELSTHCDAKDLLPQPVSFGKNNQ